MPKPLSEALASMDDMRERAAALAGMAPPDNPVFLLLAAHRGHVWIAPLGSPFDVASPGWMEVDLDD